MLITKRRMNEEICIGDDIRIVIVRLEADQVSLGVEAPKNVIIRRPKSSNCYSGKESIRDGS